MVDLGSFGQKISVRIEGGSHSSSLEGYLSGFPKGIQINLDNIKALLARRAPGSDKNGLKSTERKETDDFKVLSGLENDISNGDTIRISIANTDVRSSDYSNLDKIPRPSHADYPAYTKYGLDLNMAGGNSFSGRLTAPLTCLGGFALEYLRTLNIKIEAKIVEIGGESDDGKFAEIIDTVRKNGDSVGAIVECRVMGIKPGIGDAYFNSIESSISDIIYAIPGVKGIEFGLGFALSKMHGSESNDELCINDKKVSHKTNNMGGIDGGISNGEDIVFRVAMKPTPSISKEQHTVDLSKMSETTISVKGRHDPCIAVRAVPVIEACTGLSLLDILMKDHKRSNRDQIDEIDNKLMKLLDERFKICDEIAKYKHDNNLPIEDKNREQQIMTKLDSKRYDHYDAIYEVYQHLFDISKFNQRIHDFTTGVLKGMGMNKSSSPMLHKIFGDDNYRAVPVTETEFRSFVTRNNYEFINITSPYKKLAYELSDELSEGAKATGSVNTVIIRDGKRYGDNTDIYGFIMQCNKYNIDFSGATVAILGNGGVAPSIKFALTKLGNPNVIQVSSRGDINYSDYEKYAFVDYVINATPVGMYMNKDESIIDIDKLVKAKSYKGIKLVIDLIYNPIETKLLKDAKRNGIDTLSSLYMLVCQGASAREKYSGTKVPEYLIDKAYNEILKTL